MAMRVGVILLVAVAVTVGALSPKDQELFSAVQKDSAEAIKAALEQGADLNAIGPGGQTPIMHATLSGKEKAVAFLLTQSPDMTIGEKDGYTPMHGACFQGRAAIAEMLLAHGVNAREVHQDGYEPIFRACWGREARHTETVRVLLDAGVPPDVASEGRVRLLDATKNSATRELIKSRLKKAKAAEKEAKADGEL